MRTEGDDVPADDTQRPRGPATLSPQAPLRRPATSYRVRKPAGIGSGGDGFEPFRVSARLMNARPPGIMSGRVIQGLVMRTHTWFDFDPIAIAVLFFGIGALAALAQII
jgi:hypothetical protein